MRQFTIAERLMAATLLPLSAMLAVPYLTAALLPFLGEANAVYARIVIGLAAAQPGRNRASDVCHRQTCGGPG